MEKREEVGMKKVEERFKLRRAIPSFERLDKKGTVMVYGETVGGKRVNIVYTQGRFKVIADGFSARLTERDLKYLEEGKFATVIRRFVNKYEDFLPERLVKSVLGSGEGERWKF